MSGGTILSFAIYLGTRGNNIFSSKVGVARAGVAVKQETKREAPGSERRGRRQAAPRQYASARERDWSPLGATCGAAADCDASAPPAMATLGLSKVFILDKYFTELQRFWETEKKLQGERAPPAPRPRPPGL